MTLTEVFWLFLGSLLGIGASFVVSAVWSRLSRRNSLLATPERNDVRRLVAHPAEKD